ncbi:glycosyltransferase [Rheinheimera sp. YQF-2]|uniref:Glycosyltransferase n=1 Tax=Rheinheimera lutimaris TaxID=2740584 RepID=A0A7Y5APK0_9GAMM|nr:glycosyltransferase [Rheinheimera lutimaris]NRQ42161.1 glycosyltransferase [Rheinheimera lutimaris]
MNKIKVVIGIPTFKRPQGLRRLLESIARQQADFSPIVLVADNEGEGGSGHVTVNEMKAGYPYQLVVIAVPARGISHVRNALMLHAFDKFEADMLAMVDDDEVVEQKWIASLVKMQQLENVDVTAGTVLPEFSVEPPVWTEKLNLYWRTIHPAGRIDLVQGTGNVLLNRSVWVKFKGQHFDPVFGLTGGGDKEFFTRLKSAGATFAFTPDAVSHEFIDSSRLTKEWAKQRAYRIGCGDVRIMRKNKMSMLSWLSEAVKTLSAFVYYSVLYIFCFNSERKKMHAIFKIMRQRGKLNGIFGTAPEVYKNVHGA